MEMYLSKDNFKHLESIFNQFILDKNLPPIEFKKKLLEIMEDIGSKPVTGSLKEVNNLTLRRLRTTLYPQLNPGFAPTNSLTTSVNTNSMSRDTMLYGDRPMNSSQIVPEMQTKSEQMVETFENIKLQRTEQKEVGPMNLKVIEDKPIDGHTFEKELEKMTMLRQTPTPPPLASNPQVQPHFGSHNQIQQPIAVQESKTAISNQLLRDLSTASILEKKLETHPKDIFTMMETKSEMNKDAYSLSKIEPGSIGQVRSLAEGVDIPLRLPTSLLTNVPDTIIVDKYLLINSMDRDWIAQPSRYNFKVKFTHTTNSIQKVPIYRNNPTVPYTGSKTNPVQNLTGWFDSKGNYYPPYETNPNLSNPDNYPTGTKPTDIVGYEEIVYAADTDANIQDRFKNIVSIEVTKVILPMDISSTTSTTTTTSIQSSGAGTDNIKRNVNFNFDYPYILLQIDEFNDVYDGTDDSIRRAFCQLIVDQVYYTSTNRGYMVLRPAQKEKKLFYPTPLSSMPMLTFSMVKPTGDLLNASKDGYTVNQIYVDNNDLSSLQIKLNASFGLNEFNVGDTILFKNFAIYVVDPTQTFASTVLLNQFINRTSGHVITKAGTKSSDGYYSTFDIQCPGSFNTASGVFIVDASQTDQLNKFNAEISSGKLKSNRFEPAKFALSTNGYVINLSLQCSISMHIKQRTYDSKSIGSINV